jgi:4-diphosphocytidyl-2-C-methyl-D-erythritol kinase
MQHVDLADVIELSVGERLVVTGFADTLVTRALTALGATAGVSPHWNVQITKEIPVAAGLGGGSSDAAAALLLANESLAEPLGLGQLSEVAAGIGADVPFFLRAAPQLGTGDGSELDALDLPQDFTVVLLLPNGVRKESTASVYAEFDARNGPAGFEHRRAALSAALAGARRAEDLAELPPNDLSTSPVAEALLSAGAIRADVSGAGPCVYGIFTDAGAAREGARELETLGRTWVVAPAPSGPC